MCADPTSTPRWATSSRSALAKCSTPAFDGVVGHHARGGGVGRRRRTRSGRSRDARSPTAARRAPCGTRRRTLTSIRVLNAAGSTASTDPMVAIPALAITMSMPPKRSMPFVDSGLHGGEVAHVGDDRQHAVLAEAGGNVLQQRLVDVGQHQFGALVVQPTGHFRADAVRAARDQYDFSVHRTHGRQTYPPATRRRAGSTA